MLLMNRRVWLVNGLAILLAIASVTELRSQESRSADKDITQTLRPLIKQVVQTAVSVDATGQILDVHPAEGPGSGFPDGPVPETRSIGGAGVIADAELGLIVTSHHLVKNAETISVRLFDGRRFAATTTVVDEGADLAVLRISAPDLRAAPVGEPDSIGPGDFVVAVGDPLGLDHSASFGIVSALHRAWQGILGNDLIQTDVMLDRGSSGGPLFNLRGEIIGINTARVGRSVNERSFGFAIPASAVQAILMRARKVDY